MPLINIDKPGWYRQTTSKTYLIDVAELKQGETCYVNDSNRVNLPIPDMQAALDVQYGKGAYKVESHGSARYVRKVT